MTADHRPVGPPGLAVEGLAHHNAHLLSESAIRGRLNAQVEDRIIGETRGNLLALLEVPRGLTPADLAIGFGHSTSHRWRAESGRASDGDSRRLERG